MLVNVIRFKAGGAAHMSAFGGTVCGKLLLRPIAGSIDSADSCWCKPCRDYWWMAYGSRAKEG